MSESKLLHRPRAKKPTTPAPAGPAAPSHVPAARAPSWAGHFAGAPFALGGAVQRKVVVGPPGDTYEREADAVADRVMSGGSPTAMRISPLAAGSPSAPAPRPWAQRQAGPDEEEVRRQAAPEEEIEEAEEVPVQAWLVAQRQAAAPEEPEEDPGAGTDSPVQRQPDAPDPDEPEEPDAVAQASFGPGIGPGSARVASRLHTPGVGTPISPHVRANIEPVLGSDLSNVRVHSDTSARETATSLHARAFTHRSDIWLGPNESAHDVRLMAHEATHVVQQGAAASQRHAAPPAADTVQRLLPSWILEGIADYARHIPGWTLFTVIIGFNPLTSAAVERTPINLLGGLMGLVPFGTVIFDALQRHNVLQDAFAWVGAQLGRLDLSRDRIERTLQAAWNDVRLIEGFEYNLAVLRRHFGALYNDVVTFVRTLVDQVVQMIKDAVIGVADDLLAENRAWSLIKKVLGRDPLRDEPVDATPTEILEDFLLLIGKEQHLEQMRERETVEETANWLAEQIGTFTSLLGELRGLFTRAWDAIQPENLPNLMGNLRALAAEAGGFLQRVWDFASNVAVQVVEFIKKALLDWLSGFANEIPGFHLLTVILERNPFTAERVPRTAENLIRGFITLLPGGAAIYQRLEETGTIADAAARIEGAMAELGISWEFIVGLFTDLWNSLSIEDLADPIGTFTRITERFGEPISRLFAFVGVVLREMITIVLEMMNFPSDLIASIIGNAMQAIEDIKRDPVAFLMNMLEAVKQGFSNFFDNILTHLLSGLADWLFRALRQAGVEPPQDLTLGSILDFVLRALGITMENLWAKLAERIGQENVDRIRGAIDRLVGIWNFVRDVQERGVVAIWEYIESQISNLWNMVLDKAREWIMERIINRAIQWLMSLLDVTGIMPVINSFMAFFNAIQSAIEYLRDILTIINDYVSTVASIARGDVAPGAEKMERGLASAIPIAIGFLANQFGLGNIGERIAEIIAGLREMIDAGINWLLDQAMRLWESMMSALGMGGEEAAEEDDPEKAARVQAGLDALEQEQVQYEHDGKIELADAERVAAKVKQEHLVFQSITVVDGGTRWDYDYVASPGRRKAGPPKGGKTHLGATLLTATSFSGSLDHADWNWSDYPGHDLTAHPANVYFGYQTSSPLVKPSGEYVVQGDQTAGAPAPVAYRAQIRSEVDARKATGLNERQAQAAVADDYRQRGYSNLNGYLDLFLLPSGAWQGHHIKPVNWSGDFTAPSNLQYMRDTEHTPFTTWWSRRKAEIVRELNK
jgi:hypothetical protein